MPEPGSANTKRAEWAIDVLKNSKAPLGARLNAMTILRAMAEELDLARATSDTLRLACEGIVERGDEEARHIARGALLVVDTWR